MKKFNNNKGNYSELGKLTLKDLKAVKESNEDPTPFISDLSDGRYKAKRYGYTLELEDGRKFKTKDGVRDTKSTAKLQEIEIRDGDIVSKKFSGMAEIGGAMQGASYGRSVKMSPSDVTRLTLDTEGFKIPDGTVRAFKIKSKTNLFSMNKAGVFTGRQKEPTIGISKDNSIIRDKKGKEVGSNGSSSSSQPNKASALSLDWNSERPFRLGVEPWVTSPLMSDADDGIYIGSVKGDIIDTGKCTFTLMTKVNVTVPESVVILIKQNKAYIFKKSQLTASSGSKIFSEGTKCIEKDQEGNWRIISNKTGAYWTQKYKSEDSAKAALRAYHANKNHSDTTEDPIEKDGKVIDEGSENKNYSDMSQDDIKYTFDIKESEPKFEMQALIGTLVMSTSFVHLLHLCNTNYSMHMALDQYYKEMPEKVDKLAETYLSTTKAANFTVCIVPKSQCPVEYLTALLEFVYKYRRDKVDENKAIEAQSFGSLIDDIINLINTTLYKLKRLSNGKKLFSIDESEVAYFSDGPDDLTYYTGKIQGGVSDSVDDLVEIHDRYKDKYHKSPTKKVRDKDGKMVEVTEFVTDDATNKSLLKRAWRDTILSAGRDGRLLNIILDVISDKKPDGNSGN